MANGKCVQLAVAQPRRLAAGELRVDSGLVWVTERGNPTDVFLGAGQHYVLRRSGDALIEALCDDTRVTVESGNVLARWLADRLR